MEKMRDSIDFSSENIPALYRKVLYPTLLGMLAAVSYTSRTESSSVRAWEVTPSPQSTSLLRSF